MSGTSTEEMETVEEHGKDWVGYGGGCANDDLQELTNEKCKPSGCSGVLCVDEVFV